MASLPLSEYAKRNIVRGGGFMILVSAGHHPTKPGVCYEDFCEHDEALRWVPLIINALGGFGLAVPAGTLTSKVDFINARKPHMAVEIHFNSLRVWKDLNKNGLVDPGEMVNTGSGCLTLYCPGSVRGKELATEVQTGLEGIFKRHWRGVMEGWYRMNPANGPDFILARTNCPTIIIEPEFIHRKDLIQKNRQQACDSIAFNLMNMYDKWS